MKKNFFTFFLLSIIFISICLTNIYLSSVINKNTSTNTQLAISSDLLSDKDIAEYLNMSIDSFINFINNQELERSSVSAISDTRKYIPFIKINGTRYYKKKYIDDWLDYMIKNNKSINIK